MMPGFDGWSVCRRIRRHSNIPIIILTAREEDDDELFGFELGADEYIRKPFNPHILMARVNALLKRLEKLPAAGPKKAGSLTIDEKAIRCQLMRKY